jgi:hypothetical protein
MREHFVLPVQPSVFLAPEAIHENFQQPQLFLGSLQKCGAHEQGQGKNIDVW